MQAQTQLGSDDPLRSWRTIVALLWLGFVGLSTFQLIPLVTGALVDVYGFADASAGLVSSFYWGAGFVASLFAFFWLPRWDRRSALIAFVLVGLVAELSSVFLTSYTAVAVGRAFTGFAGASVTCIVLATITGSARSERLYGLYAASVSFFAAIGFLVLPHAVPAMLGNVGVGSLFAIFSAFWAVGLIAVTFVPHGAATAASVSIEERPPKLLTPAIVVLFLSLVVFYIANGGLWAFLDRVGVWTGLDAAQIGLALSVGNVFAIIGGLAASAIGLRFRVAAPVLIGTGLTIVANLVLLSKAGMVGYSIGNFLSFAFVIFTVSAYLQAFGVVDQTGRLMAAASLAVFGGGALGPVVLGLFLPTGTSPDYSSLIVVDTVLFALAPVLFVAGWIGVRKRVGARPELPLSNAPEAPPAS